MKRLIKALAILLALVFCFSLVSCSKKDYTTVTLEDNGALITNPNMGWNFAYYSNTFTEFNQYLGNNDYLDEFPCDVLFMRVGWSYWNPAENEYAWDSFEEVLKPWWDRGKRVVLGFVATHPGDQNTPLWVKDAGANGIMYYWDRTVKTDKSGYAVLTDGKVEYTDEVYESGSRFDGQPKYVLSYSEYDLNQNGRLDEGETDPNGDGWLDPTWQSQQDFLGSTTEAVAWGLNTKKDSAWNNGQEVDLSAVDGYKNLRPTWVVNYDDPVFLDKYGKFLEAAAERYDGTDYLDVVDICSLGDWGEGHSAYTRGNKFNAATIRKHIDLYRKYFTKTPIVINDDCEPYYGEGFSEYCIENDVGVVDCSVAISEDIKYGAPGNIGNVAVTDLFWRDEIVMLENHFGMACTSALLESVNQCHASYARIHYDPQAYLDTEWADAITLRLGYRLNFTEVSFSKLQMGSKLKIEFKMKNTGAAPCYQGGNPTFYIIDSSGQILCETTSEFDVKDLVVKADVTKAPESTGTAMMQLPKQFYKDQTGRYYLAVAVTVDGEPYYNLPLDNQDENGRKIYKVATFTIGEVF